MLHACIFVVEEPQNSERPLLTDNRLDGGRPPPTKGLGMPYFQRTA